MPDIGPATGVGKIVIGIDGGGSVTRALAADLTGRALAYAEAGPASPDKAPDAEQNVRQAIREVLAQAGRHPAEVAALVAGIAGLNDPEDQIWAEQFTALPGLEGVRLHVNDAEIAHAGALRSRPGIIVIGGTGSAVYGVTPAGRKLFNTQFHHYARGARHVAHDAMHRILAGEATATDGDLVAEVARFWGTRDLSELRELGASGFAADRFTRNRRFAEMAPLVTGAAGCGSPLARQVCLRTAEAFATGIRLVGECFPEGPLPVALTGPVVRSPEIKEPLKALLAEGNPSYHLVEPLHSCVEGAVLMALQAAGVTAPEGRLPAL